MPFLQRSQSPAGESQFRTIDNAPTLPNLRQIYRPGTTGNSMNSSMLKFY